MKVAFLHQHGSIRETIVVSVLEQLAPTPLDIVSPAKAQLLIVGPFRRPGARVLAARLLNRAGITLPPTDFDKLTDPALPRRQRPLVLYYSTENPSLYPEIDADYYITQDLGMSTSSRFRLSWWQYLDWQHEGIDVKPLRSHRKVDIKRLQTPLGRDFLKRERRGVLITTHLREPRASLFAAMQQVVPMDGYGRAFDNTIRSHNESPFLKEDILKNYAFNLCPENSLYPGYYTEKIPEAFACGCLPVTWVDTNVAQDFNPRAMVNLLPEAGKGYADAIARHLEPAALERFADEPLVHEAPSLEPLRDFLRRVLADAR